MKWIGQHIWDQASKFRNTVDFSEDVTFYQPVNGGDPTISIGSSATERLEIKASYESGAQGLDLVRFTTFTAGGGSDDGRYAFEVDDVFLLNILDGGLRIKSSGFLEFGSGNQIISDSSGTTTLKNIDALDATTISTFETALETNIDTLAGLTSIGTAGTELTIISNSVFDVNRTAAQGNAGAENITALHVDFDRTVPTSGTYAHNDIGIDLDVTSASLGTSSLYGMDIDVTGDPLGTSVATGIDLLVHRADTNYGIFVQSEDTQLKLAYSAFNYATFTTSSTGGLTIETVGSGTTDSDLILDADGLIDLQHADGKSVRVTSTEVSGETTGGALNLISDDGAALGDDHRIGKIGFLAAEDSSSTYRQGAMIAAYADAASSASENGTRLEFYTMDGNNSSELSLTLDSDLLATFAGAVTVTGALTMPDDTVTFAKAVGVSPKVYGSTIKILPSDFMSNDDGGSTKFGIGFVETDGTGFGMKIPNSGTELLAFVSIPEGMKATHVDIFDQADDRVIEVFEANVNSRTITSKGSGNCNTTLDITDVNATAVNYLLILVTTTATSDRVYGGTVTISAQ